jgi:general secretion pathway protein C
LTPDLIFKVLGDRRLRILVLLLVLAALAHQVSLLVWQLVPTPPLTNQLAAAPMGGAGEAQSGAANYQQQASAISQALLFGKAEVAQMPVQVAETAPETQLNYKLRGIYFSPDPELSSAIVETRPNDTRNFRLDEELADKITLARIEKDHILLSRYGKLERLNLEKPEALAAGNVSSNPGSAGVSSDQVALLRSYKKRYTSNPMALATRFQAIPVQQNGVNIGFKLKALRGESLLKKLDFEPDDVFTAVNGVSLKNPFEAMDALKSLTTASSFSITFMRNGSEQTMDIKI